MRNTPKFVLALLVGVVLVAAGCTSADGPAAEGGGATTARRSATSTASDRPVTGSIIVSAAASLTDSFETIGAHFHQANPGVSVRFNFDGSSTLATQILGGAPADGFASADEATMAELTRAHQVAGTPQVFARNRLTIVVKRGNPEHIRTLADLAAAGTISLCGADVPCGRYAEQMLERAHVTVPADRITRGQNVRATLAAVAEGDADAGIVYATDVVGDNVEGVAVPAAQNVVATYPIGVLEGATNPAAMRAFIAYLLSASGQATLRSAGFLPPT